MDKKLNRFYKNILGDNRKYKTKDWEIVKRTEDFLCVRNKKTGEIIRRSIKSKV